MKQLLCGQRVRLRALEPEDLALLYQWENDTETWLVSNTVTPFSRHILQHYLEQAHEDLWSTKQLRLMIEVPELHSTIGAIDLYDLDPLNLRAGVGILIAEKKFRKQGFATESLQLLIGYARKRIGLHQLYCSIAVDNKSSLQLFRQGGFTKTGTHKQWIKKGDRWVDELFFQLILRPEDQDNPEKEGDNARSRS